MGKKIEAFLHSLGLRLLVPLLLTSGAVVAIYAEVSFRSTRQQLLALVTADAERSSELIRRATHDGMLLNRKDDVQRTLERLAGGTEVAAVRVYDKRGGVFLSAHPEEIGRNLEITAEPCRVCHGENGRRRPAALAGTLPLPQVVEGEETLRHLAVIPNEPGCVTAACHVHQSGEEVLGVLDVEMSMEPLGQALRASRRQLAWAALNLALVIVAVSAAFVARSVLRPLARLREGTRRIAAGDLAVRVEERGPHELTQLAAAFNRMAGDLETARREITDWSRTLEQKVVEKTEDLRRTQQQVLHMERMASLGKLSATVAHELNNPLSGILMYSRLVGRELGDQPLESAVREELQGYLRLIDQECRRCGNIVGNLLLFARRSGAEMAPVDLEEVVERSLMLVRHHLEMHGVSLVSEPLEGDRAIVADAGQIEQALVALLVNAVEAMSGPGGAGGGGGELTVRRSGDAEEVTIDIADTGVGIPPEVRPHIFEPFFSTKHEESGVGLGLAVVYGIVRRHGGSIEVDSEPGHGTVFHLRLPRRPPPQGAEAGNAEAERNES